MVVAVNDGGLAVDREGLVGEFHGLERFGLGFLDILGLADCCVATKEEAMEQYRCEYRGMMDLHVHLLGDQTVADMARVFPGRPALRLCYIQVPACGVPTPPCSAAVFHNQILSVPVQE